MHRSTPTRVVILGGGFAGLAAAVELERTGRGNDGVEVTLVNRDNYILFTPMLHEVAASDIDITHIVNPLRKLLRRTRVFTGVVEGVDLERRRVRVSHDSGRHPHVLEYDHLVLALGSVTNFYGIPGLSERALTMKSLDDAVALRNRLIERLEEADFECAAALRSPLLTFVVAGGGFAGVETVAALNDFLREALRFYPGVAASDVRVVLVDASQRILPELDESLSRYARRKLVGRGIEVRLGAGVTSVTEEAVHLSDGVSIPARTVIWTAGVSANPLVSSLPCAVERGRLITNEFLEVRDWPGVWAVGDCASIVDARTGGRYPPTAQHALREGRLAGRNVAATIRGEALRPFRFATLGQLAAIGRRTGVANILGVNFSGFIAWWLWRTIYLAKLPRLEKKVRVALDWTLDLVFSKDLVALGTARTGRATALPAIVPAPSRRPDSPAAGLA